MCFFEKTNTSGNEPTSQETARKLHGEKRQEGQRSYHKGDCEEHHHRLKQTMQLAKRINKERAKEGGREPLKGRSHEERWPGNNKKAHITPVAPPVNKERPRHQDWQRSDKTTPTSHKTRHHEARQGRITIIFHQIPSHTVSTFPFRLSTSLFQCINHNNIPCTKPLISLFKTHPTALILTIWTLTTTDHSLLTK